MRPRHLSRVDRRRAVATVTLALGLGFALPVSPQSADEKGPVVEAVSAALEVERTMLEQDLDRYRSLSRERTEIATRVGQLQRSLDAAVQEGEQGSFNRLGELLEQLHRAEGDLGGLRTEGRVTVASIRDRLRRIALLEEKLDGLASRERAPKGALTGIWDLTLMPLEQRGACTLHQAGTLVNGTYELSGGWSGSLRGTLVNRKVFLVRIDARLGKSMELEGYLSSDGTSIRGSWVSYELAGSEGGAGEWIARRRDP